MFAGCKKEQHGSASRIDIYLLKSFTTTVDQSTIPAIVSITNAVLEYKPLVADQDIQLYTKSTTTFTLRKDMRAIIQDYGTDKAFAVTVNNQPVYYGIFYPPYLSSLACGVATISPILPTKNELKIDFVLIEGNDFLQQLDKRNDSQIINALKETNRLR